MNQKIFFPPFPDLSEAVPVIDFDAFQGTQKFLVDLCLQLLREPLKQPDELRPENSGLLQGPAVSHD